MTTERWVAWASTLARVDETGLPTGMCTCPCHPTNSRWPGIVRHAKHVLRRDGRSDSDDH